MFAALWTALGGARLLGWLAAGLTLLASLFAAMASLKSAGRAEQRAADAAKTARIRDEQIHVTRPDPGELDERLRSGRF